MTTKSKNEAQNPLILRCHRLMDAFAKSNDERDFYLDRMEGFILYADLDKSETEIQNLEKELEKHSDRYVLIPKLTFYETKKIMEGFVNEKVYDIDTKEKLLDIIQSKEARENFLEFIYDHHSEYEKWQQFYQERSRIRIIEWLRQNNFYFVFEEDLELSRKVVEALKRQLFQTKASKDVLTARKALVSKAKTYYSNEALNPRPKRGRPPKQAVKAEIEPQITSDIYTTVPPASLPFLYTPEITTLSAITFSAKFETEEDLLANKRQHSRNEGEITIESFNEKLASLRSLSSKWLQHTDKAPAPAPAPATPPRPSKVRSKYIDEDDIEDEEEEEEDDELELTDFDEESSFDDGEEEEDEKPSKVKEVKRKAPPPPAKKKTPVKVAAKTPVKVPVKTPAKAPVKAVAVKKKVEPPKKPAPAKKPAPVKKVEVKKPVAPTKKKAPPPPPKKTKTR